MRLIGLLAAVVVILTIAPAGAGAAPKNAGDLIAARTLSSGTMSTHMNRKQVDADFANFWTRGLACQTIRNLFVLKPRLDTYLYNPVEGGPLGPGGGGTGPKRYVWAKSKLPISVSHVSCKMMKGSLSGADGTDNVAFTYTTRLNYIDGKYTLSRFQVGSGNRIGYAPVVRVYFDAALHVTLAEPVPNGPVTVAARSVTVSNLSTMSLLAKDAPTIQGLVAHLGVATYNPPRCALAIYL